MGCIRKSTAISCGEVMLPLYSALVKHIWSTDLLQRCLPTRLSAVLWSASTSSPTGLLPEAIKAEPSVAQHPALGCSFLYFRSISVRNCSCHGGDDKFERHFFEDVWFWELDLNTADASKWQFRSANYALNYDSLIFDFTYILASLQQILTFYWLKIDL